MVVDAEGGAIEAVDPQHQSIPERDRTCDRVRGSKSFHTRILAPGQRQSRRLEARSGKIIGERISAFVTRKVKFEKTGWPHGPKVIMLQHRAETSISGTGFGVDDIQQDEQHEHDNDEGWNGYLL
jgi:hypothetical protein